MGVGDKLKKYLKDFIKINHGALLKIFPIALLFLLYLMTFKYFNYSYNSFWNYYFWLETISQYFFYLFILLALIKLLKQPKQGWFNFILVLSFCLSLVHIFRYIKGRQGFQYLLEFVGAIDAHSISVFPGRPPLPINLNLLYLLLFTALIYFIYKTGVKKEKIFQGILSLIFTYWLFIAAFYYLLIDQYCQSEMWMQTTYTLKITGIICVTMILLIICSKGMIARNKISVLVGTVMILFITSNWGTINIIQEKFTAFPQIYSSNIDSISGLSNLIYLFRVFFDIFLILPLTKLIGLLLIIQIFLLLKRRVSRLDEINNKRTFSSLIPYIIYWLKISATFLLSTIIVVVFFKIFYGVLKIPRRLTIPTNYPFYNMVVNFILLFCLLLFLALGLKIFWKRFKFKKHIPFKVRLLRSIKLNSIPIIVLLTMTIFLVLTLSGMKLRPIDYDLWNAVRAGEREQTEICLKKGANYHIKDSNNSNLLHIADIDTLPLIIRYGLDINHENNSHKTPLFRNMSRYLNEYEIKRAVILINHGAKIYIPSPRKNAYKYIFQELANLISNEALLLKEYIKYSIKNNKIHKTDPEGRTLLHYAAAVGDPVLIHKLLEKGLKMIQQDKNGLPPIWFAIANDNMTI